MAIMIPDETADFSTAGEGTFYRFLQAVAKPDHHYIAWYLPDIQGHEPDYIVYSTHFGLVPVPHLRRPLRQMLSGQHEADVFPLV